MALASLLSTLLLHAHADVVPMTNRFKSGSSSNSSSFVFIADLRVGEGCATADGGYQLNDTNCYSVQDLRRTVQRINSLAEPPKFVIVGGDITSSAQETEFVAAKQMLDNLSMPYFPALGNHDMWSYDQIVGDRTATPQGDRLFSQQFADIFTPLLEAGAVDQSFTYPNASSYNPAHNCTSAFQSWELHAGGAAADATFGHDPNFEGRTSTECFWLLYRCMSVCLVVLILCRTQLS